MRRQALIAHLRAHGCRLRHEGARHPIYENPANGRTTSVPRHTEIDDFLARNICRDLEIPSIERYRGDACGVWEQVGTI
jgi:hypothetical protein